MQSIDKYLATAITHIKDESNNFLENGQIPKVYKGYIASFGTIIKQSGLLPAVVLFSNTQASGDANKGPILEAIFKLLKAHTNLVEETHLDLLAFAIAKKDDSLARKEMIRAAIALKLALRTFKIQK